MLRWNIRKRIVLLQSMVQIIIQNNSMLTHYVIRIVLEYVPMLKIYSSIPLKKAAFCLKTSHFINKYDPPRSQLCQWPRLVHNCNQSFNMFRPSVYFDSHQNISASHLGIPGGIENLEMQY